MPCHLLHEMKDQHRERYRSHVHRNSQDSFLQRLVRLVQSHRSVHGCLLAAAILIAYTLTKSTPPDAAHDVGLTTIVSSVVSYVVACVVLVGALQLDAVREWSIVPISTAFSRSPLVTLPC